MNRNSLKITINRPDKQSVGIFLWLNLNLLLAIARYILTRAGFETGMVREAVLFMTTCIPFAYLIISQGGAKKKTLPSWLVTFLGLYVSIVLVFLISLIFNPVLKNFYFRKSYGIGNVFSLDGAIFAFLFFAMFDDSTKLRNAMTKSAYVMFFYLLVVVFLPAFRQGYWLDIAPGGGTMKFSYSLSFGYDMMFPFTVFFTIALKSHKPIHYALALFSAILIITNGGRGSTVVLAMFFMLLIIISIIDGKTSPVKKFFLVSSIIVVGIILIAFGEELLALLISILKSHNINSRSIETLLNGSFSDSNGRELIWKTVIEAIRKGGLFGYGLFGDRPFVAPIHVAGYSHNLFLELLVSFGIVGAFVIVCIIVDAVKMIIFCKDEDWRIIYVILFTCSCKLMLSLSLWYAWEFWAAAAVAYKYRILKKRNLLLT